MIPLAGNGGGEGIKLEHGSGGGIDSLDGGEELVGTFDGKGGRSSIASPVEMGLEANAGRAKSEDDGIGGGGGIDELRAGTANCELVEHIGGSRSEKSLISHDEVGMELEDVERFNMEKVSESCVLVFSWQLQQQETDGKDELNMMFSSG